MRKVTILLDMYRNIQFFEGKTQTRSVALETSDLWPMPNDVCCFQDNVLWDELLDEERRESALALWYPGNQDRLQLETAKGDLLWPWPLTLTLYPADLDLMTCLSPSGHHVWHVSSLPTCPVSFIWNPFPFPDTLVIPCFLKFWPPNIWPWHLTLTWTSDPFDPLDHYIWPQIYLAWNFEGWPWHLTYTCFTSEELLCASCFWKGAKNPRMLNSGIYLYIGNLLTC